MQKETFEVEYQYEGERLDKYVSILFPEQSRSFFQKMAGALDVQLAGNAYYFGKLLKKDTSL